LLEQSIRQYLIDKNKTIVDSSLCPRCATHNEYMAFTVEPKFVEMGTVVLTIMLYSHC